MSEPEQATLTSKHRACIVDIQIKEDGSIPGLLATTHPDREGEILSKGVLQTIVDKINDTSKAGDVRGAYRSVSLYHDWIKEGNPRKDEVAFLVPGSASLVQLDDGRHFGVAATAKINEFYRGELTPEEVKYRIQNGGIAGFSIEFVEGDSTPVTVGGNTFKLINTIKEFNGVAFARARAIANPHAIFYKEIETFINDQTHKTEDMQEQETPQATPAEPVATETPSQEAPSSVSEPTAAEEPAVKETPVSTNPSSPAIDIKELLQTKEFKEAVQAEIKVKTKTHLTSAEDQTMTDAETISVKEMNAALQRKDPFGQSTFDLVAFKEAASTYFTENPQIDAQLKGTGIVLNNTLKVKCSGNKLRIMGTDPIKAKGVLDTNTNTSAYTQNIVEFADLYTPVLVDTFNNQTNLFGALNKVDHMNGGDKYGWKITTNQKSSLSVDPDDVAIGKDPVTKLKLQTKICEYRSGVSVTDFVQYHSRATMGDLLMVEVQKRMNDLMRDLNGDLFTEQVDSGTKVIGLEAVADSAGNTTLYGITRSAANRLAPASASDTYNAVGGALTTALVRGALTKVETEGAARGNLMIITSPTQRDKLLELDKGLIRYMGDPATAHLGFGLTSGAVQFTFDGIPVCVDSQAPTDALWVVDRESYYLVVSRAPQMTGLAKIGAAEDAYVNIYIAAVYEQPRRIHQLDTLS